jgi:membrane-bound ClpP family serine protease
MAWAIIISLIIAGLVFILLELLVIPGTGILGIIGLGLIVFSIWSAYTHHSNLYGHYTLAATLVVSVLSVVLAIKSKTWNKAMLQENIEGKTNVFEKDAVKVGDTGVAISRLNPMGKALINNDYYEVNARGAFIDQEQEITVIKVEGNKIYVKLKS